MSNGRVEWLSVSELVLSISSVKVNLTNACAHGYGCLCGRTKVKGQFNLKNRTRTKSASVRRCSIKANQFIRKPYRDLSRDYF